MLMTLPMSSALRFAPASSAATAAAAKRQKKGSGPGDSSDSTPDLTTDWGGMLQVEDDFDMLAEYLLDDGPSSSSAFPGFDFSDVPESISQNSAPAAAPASLHPGLVSPDQADAPFVDPLADANEQFKKSENGATTAVEQMIATQAAAAEQRIKGSPAPAASMPQAKLPQAPAPPVPAPPSPALSAPPVPAPPSPALSAPVGAAAVARPGHPGMPYPPVPKVPYHPMAVPIPPIAGPAGGMPMGSPPSMSAPAPPPPPVPMMHMNIPHMGPVPGAAPSGTKRRRANASAPPPPPSVMAINGQIVHTGGGRRQKSQEQIDRRRERNKILARRTRLRKKFFFESLQKDVADLQRENAALKHLVQTKLDPKAAKTVLDSCTASEKIPSGVLAECGIEEETTKLDRKDFNLIKSIQSSQQCFVITDPSLQDNPIVYASDDFLSLTGYQREDVLGRNCRFLQGKETSRAKVEQISKAVSNGDDCTVTLLNYTAEGVPFWNNLFIAALRDAQDNIVNFIGVIVKVSSPEPGDPEYGKTLQGEAAEAEGAPFANGGIKNHVGSDAEAAMAAEGTVKAIEGAVSAAVAAAPKVGLPAPVL